MQIERNEKSCVFFFVCSHPVKCKYKENNCGKVRIFLCFIIFRGNSVQKYETIIAKKKVEKYLQNWELSFSIGIYMDSSKG